MRFLLDENLSPALADLLAEAGHQAVHVRDLDLSRADDEQVLAAAAADDRILMSADTDFGELLARTNADHPSVLLLRRQTGRRAADVTALVVANLDPVRDDLEAGAIVVLDDTRVRVRRLPLST